MPSRLPAQVGCCAALALVLTAAGATPSATPRPVATVSRLAPCGQALCRQDGSRFDWRGVTAFALADLIADGHEPAARAFVTWAAGRGFTVLRVLAMNHGWMELSPAEGRRALPKLLALAREHGLYVQVVALAGTGLPEFDREPFLVDQVRAIGAECAKADNCVLELANEPYHGSQADLDQPSRLERLRREVPSTVPVAWGAARTHTSPALSGGDFVVAHLSRSGQRWDRVERLLELRSLAGSIGKFVVDNEPIGAAEQASPGRRDDFPAAFFAQAAVAGLLQVGATFHCEDCLEAKVPGPVQQRCAEAFTAGALFARTDAPTHQVSPGAEQAPLEAVHGAEAPKVLMAGAGNETLIVALGDASQLKWRRNWRVIDHSSPAPDVHAWRARKIE